VKSSHELYDSIKIRDILTMYYCIREGVLFMRKTAQRAQNQQEPVQEPEYIEIDRPSEAQPWVEELHAVSAASTVAWKTPSVVSSEDPDDPSQEKSFFLPVGEELDSADSRPIAPDNATIIREKEVVDHFHFSDDQLTYKKGMGAGSFILVTLRKTAVWFSDLWDKYVLFIKNNVPSVYEAHRVQHFTLIGIIALCALILLLVVGAITIL